MCLGRSRKPWPFEWWQQQCKGIVEASSCNWVFSWSSTQRWAFAYFSTLSQYPGSLDDQYVETELSSELQQPHCYLTWWIACTFVHENAYTERVSWISRQVFSSGSMIVLVLSLLLTQEDNGFTTLVSMFVTIRRVYFFDGHECDDVSVSGRTAREIGQIGWNNHHTITIMSEHSGYRELVHLSGAQWDNFLL